MLLPTQATRIGLSCPFTEEEMNNNEKMTAIDVNIFFIILTLFLLKYDFS
jgi:hypothetical protein